MGQLKPKRLKFRNATICIQSCGCICVFPLKEGLIINNSNSPEDTVCNLHGVCYWLGCSCKVEDETK